MFAAVMVVNAFAAVVAHRRAELHRLWLLGATPQPGRGAPSSPRPASSPASAWSWGCSPRWPRSSRSGSPAHEGLVPDGQLWLPPLVVAGVVALTLLSARSAVRRTAPAAGRDRRGPMTDSASMATRASCSRSESVRPGAGRRGRPRRPAAADRGLGGLRAAHGARAGPRHPDDPAAIPLGLVAVGFAPRLRRRPGHRGAHRGCTAGSAARCSGRTIATAYADTTGTSLVDPAGALADATGPAGGTSGSSGSRRPAGS